jgi:hypothetical protein
VEIAVCKGLRSCIFGRAKGVSRVAANKRLFLMVLFALLLFALEGLRPVKMSPLYVSNQPAIHKSPPPSPEMRVLKQQRIYKKRIHK